MPTDPNRLSRFWRELKRRKVVHVIMVYAASAYVIIELINNVAEPLRLPDWTPTLVIVLLAIGFPLAIIFSWIFDVTPEGLEKTKPAQKVKGEEGPAASSGWKIATYISIVVIAVLVIINILPHRTNQGSIPDKSIAVLPFEDMSSEQDQEYFCDGMSEEIINSLAQLDSLKVIARTSTFAFKGKQEDIREIGRILDVGAVLEGSVQKVGSRLRITAQLINVEDGTHMWSERYDREMEDVFRIQDEISQAIVDQLQIELLGKRAVVFGRRQTENVEAYNLYLKGRFFWHRRTEEDMLKSMEQFNLALELDSTYALAYAGLADDYFIMTWWGYFPRDDGFELAKTNVYKALSINENLPEAHAALGGILTWYDWDWKGAEKELKLAISLNPNDANAYQYYSELMNVLGRTEESREYINKALELNPHSWIMYNLSSGYYLKEGAYEKAIEECSKALEVVKSGWPQMRLFICYYKLGNNQEAIRQLKEIVSLDPSFNQPEVLDSILLESGMDGILRWYIHWLQTNEDPDFYFNVNLNSRIANLYGILGDSQLAMEYLEKAWEVDESSMPSIYSNPSYEFLENEPGFKAMLKAMNLGQD
jgi:TolB-like protein